jgi:hypothetical protein
MTIFFKPTRGLQKASFRESGISHLQLIRFLEQCQKRLEMEGETDAAFRFEMVAEYFKQDYKPGHPVQFSGSVLGL